MHTRFYCGVDQRDLHGCGVIVEGADEDFLVLKSRDEKGMGVIIRNDFDSYTWWEGGGGGGGGGGTGEDCDVECMRTSEEGGDDGESDVASTLTDGIC